MLYTQCVFVWMDRFLPLNHPPNFTSTELSYAFPCVLMELKNYQQESFLYTHTSAYSGGKCTSNSRLCLLVSCENLIKHTYTLKPTCIHLDNSIRSMILQCTTFIYNGLLIQFPQFFCSFLSPHISSTGKSFSSPFDR